MANPLHILLADDDEDDRYFFAKALEKLTTSTKLTTVVDGERLIDYLVQHTTELPDILFLDINMPRKKGTQCLVEIKANKNLNALPIIIYSTCLTESMVDELYENGAHYCLQKGEVPDLVNYLRYVLLLLAEKKFTRPTRAHFVINLQEITK